MGSAIGDTLPLAVGIAISPIPIIAAVLMLLSPRARTTSVGFLLGWLLGIVVAVVVFTLLSAIIPASDPDATKPVVGIVEIVLGVLLLLLALRQWRGRPRNGATASLPAWMNAIDSMTSVRALLLGFILSAVNPKNLLMAVSAGLAIGSASLDVGRSAVVIVVFVVVACCTVALPVLAYLVAADRMRGPLDRLREWLSQNNAVIMAVLLVVIGFVMVGKGIRQF
jgi:threonine/homoserine/homoserine lactone efflux protein